MAQVYSTQEKSGNDYKPAQEKEKMLVENLMASKAGSYRISSGNRRGYRAPRSVKSVYAKKPKRTFVPTQCKFCGAEVSYGSISKSRLRAAGSVWIDSCDNCAVNPDVTKDAKVYLQ